MINIEQEQGATEDHAVDNKPDINFLKSPTEIKITDRNNLRAQPESELLPVKVERKGNRINLHPSEKVKKKCFLARPVHQFLRLAEHFLKLLWNC